MPTEVEQATPDGRFTLLTVECLGSCGTAPIMQVDEKVDRISAELALGVGDQVEEGGQDEAP